MKGEGEFRINKSSFTSSQSNLRVGGKKRGYLLPLTLWLFDYFNHSVAEASKNPTKRCRNPMAAALSTGIDFQWKSAFLIDDLSEEFVKTVEKWRAWPLAVQKDR